MSMFFFDDAKEMEEYNRVKKTVRALEKEYLELRLALQEAQKELQADPQGELQQARVKYLEKRIRQLEEKNPWLSWNTPIEIALFSPPHG
jgi:hypothetical protein|uniref:Uncharacterized protein n=1 Tax=Desulfobacca acetoxidans TaxID=60893 RepID=A0A7C3WRH9_9BACT